MCRFDLSFRGVILCPTCLRRLPIDPKEVTSDKDKITEEHIIPESVGGKVTSFLCKKCNSHFGQNQTRWLSEFIQLNEGGILFPLDPKKQKAGLHADGLRIGGHLRLASDGAIEFVDDRSRTNPADYDKFWSSPNPPEITISYKMEVFNNENSLRVGYLTAAYCLWFKHFGYSWALQSHLNDVRTQILYPERNIITWNYLIDVNTREIANPSLGMAKFRDQIFPFAHIYDHLVLLPSALARHPCNVSHSEIVIKNMVLEPEIGPRCRHRCVGPSSFVCDGQEIIKPDMFAETTVPIESIQASLLT